ncbi:hypothetical protein [Bradyrhizobium macuxiense]|uniref:hypothetical protein n=1 Tax=Bradyrhizobium macuxiense TaxID=1755647 RepID=UPI0011BFB04A|nr:hypothetical protein [Bradyrhizobium macuxiense]
MKLADFVSKLKTSSIDAAENPIVFVALDLIFQTTALAVLSVIGWGGVYLFLFARSHSSFAGVASISCGILILMLAAWRALKADIKAPDAPRMNWLMIWKRRAGGACDYRD